MHTKSLNNLKHFSKGFDPRRNINGRPLGSRNLSTIINQVDESEIQWHTMPTAQKSVTDVVGMSWRAIVYVAIAKACGGDVEAMRWLSSVAYRQK